MSGAVRYLSKAHPSALVIALCLVVAGIGCLAIGLVVHSWARTRAQASIEKEIDNLIKGRPSESVGKLFVTQPRGSLVNLLFFVATTLLVVELLDEAIRVYLLKLRRH